MNIIRLSMFVLSASLAAAAVELARIEEPDLPLVWPMPEEPDSDRDRYARKKGSGSAWTF